ncbi:uncharacterized protein [Clytia hemisphaerica]|uniref:Uncharacterized protein n=1 Tax=Clytia hemisphaerica TaxID=252671 RepID=A0A7M5UAS2_9CNID|eukprot:TCONS_00013731-protein
MLKMQLLTAIILVLGVSIGHVEAKKKNYRVSGIIEFMSFWKPRGEIIGMTNFFKNNGKLGEFIRKADNFLTTTQVTGQISIELPDGNTGIIATYEGEYVHFAQPLLFSFDYESSGSLMPKFKITCNLEVPDWDGFYVCDGSETYQAQYAPTPKKPSSESVQSHLSNTLRNQLAPLKEKLEKQLQSKSTKSGDLDSVLDLLMTGMHMYGYEKLHKSKEGYENMKNSIKSLIQLGKDIGAELDGGLLSIILKFLSNLTDIEDAMFDITGAFLINLNTQKIGEDDGGQPNRIEGHWQTTRTDVVRNDYVEGFGQLYILPESIIFGLADFAESLGTPIPDTSPASDLELPFIRGKAYPLYQLRRWVEATNWYEFNWQLHHRYTPLISSDTPNEYVVFMNMWDSDGNGAVDFDDCLGKGNALGLETVDVTSGSYRFSQCDNDDSVYTTFSKDKEPQKDDGADLVWYELAGALTYYTYDGNGDYYDPFGHLYFNIGSRPINQGLVVWDVPRDQSSAVLDYHNQSIPYAIYFRESKDFMQSNEKITSLGWATENDGALGGDDPIGDWNNHEWSVSTLSEGVDYENKFTDTGAWATIKLSLTSIGVVDPPPEKVDYELTVKMDFWCNSDGESHYEAYGDLTVNIGEMLENQNINLWHRNEGDNIVEKLNTVHTETFHHTFTESPHFIDASQTTSKVVTLNSVREDDNGGDDTIGNYNGHEFKPSDLVGNKDYKEFKQDSWDWVRLTLTITPLTSTRSLLHEYVLEGTLYMIEKEDSGTNYEAYGYLDVDIGNRMSNKNREMWQRQPSNHLSIKKGKGHTVKLNDVRFYERAGFLNEASKQTMLVHGYVREDDNNGQDKYIGNYEGLSIPTHELARPQGITRTFASNNGSGGRVILKLKLRNYTEENEAEEVKDREMLAKREAEKEKAAKNGKDIPVKEL